MIDPTEVSIRDAVEADAANLAALSIQVWLHTYATDGIRSAISELVLGQFTPAHFARVISLPKYKLCVAIYREHLIGYALIDQDSVCPLVESVTAELVSLYVQEHFTGQQVGSKLLVHALSEIKGEPNLWLSVYIHNGRAIKFYNTHGFVRVGVVPFEFGIESHMNEVLVRSVGIAPSTD